jgi:hypothetical protein
LNPIIHGIVGEKIKTDISRREKNDEDQVLRKEKAKSEPIYGVDSDDDKGDVDKINEKRNEQPKLWFSSDEEVPFAYKEIKIHNLENMHIKK